MEAKVAKSGTIYSDKFVIKNVTALYPKVGTKDEYQGKSKYKCDILANDVAEFSEIQKAVDAVATKAKFKKFRSPIQAGEDKVTESGEPAAVYSDWGFYCKTGTIFDISVYDKGNRKLTDPEEIDKLFYSGCKVSVQLAARAYKSANGAGVTVDLHQIKFVDDGERLGGEESCAFGAESADEFPED